MKFKVPSLGKLIGFPDLRPTPMPDAPRPDFDPASLGEMHVFLVWQAQSRAASLAYNKKFMRTGIVIGLVIALLLVLMQEFFLILMVASIFFFTYVLSKTVPEIQKYEVSTRGITIGDKMYYWHDLRRFFFTKNSGLDVLAVDTFLGLPSRLFISVRPEDISFLKETISTKIQFLEAEPKTVIDRGFESILGKFNFEDKKEV